MNMKMRGPTAPMTEQQQASAEVPEMPNDIALRDWFAGQALAVIRNSNSPDEHAFFAYELADAMLRARVTVAKGGE